MIAHPSHLASRYETVLLNPQKLVALVQAKHTHQLFELMDHYLDFSWSNRYQKIRGFSCFVSSDCFQMAHVHLLVT